MKRVNGARRFTDHGHEETGVTRTVRLSVTSSEAAITFSDVSVHRWLVTTRLACCCKS